MKPNVNSCEKKAEMSKSEIGKDSNNGDKNKDNGNNRNVIGQVPNYTPRAENADTCEPFITVYTFGRL
jgi:hypothetical protein